MQRSISIKSLSTIHKRKYTTKQQDKGPFKRMYLHPTPDNPEHIKISPLKTMHNDTSLIALTKRMNIENDMIDMGQVQVNLPFKKILQEVISRSVYDDPVWIEKAQKLENGFMNIYDKRSILGRAVPSEDIFGMVLLEHGVMVRGTYQEMPMHELVSPSGVFVLEDYLHEALVTTLDKLNQ
eukprot:TRINITY_DN12577_c0_g1_i1.p1 TRINITY_DN12577_c0_g1~~TRINITY_DN12577_c0_g1_i1.p1  ORF type:complete len:204 (+),score=47.06 TRINITY_DN12577_c0_g1_i1:72-614(+)